MNVKEKDKMLVQNIFFILCLVFSHCEEYPRSYYIVCDVFTHHYVAANFVSYTHMYMVPSTTAIGFMAVTTFIRRNLVSITFPVFTATLIWLDWSHTRKWKSQQKLQK